MNLWRRTAQTGRRSDGIDRHIPAVPADRGDVRKNRGRRLRSSGARAARSDVVGGSCDLRDARRNRADTRRAVEIFASVYGAYFVSLLFIVGILLLICNFGFALEYASLRPGVGGRRALGFVTFLGIGRAELAMSDAC